MTEMPFVVSTPGAIDTTRVDAAAPFFWIRRGICFLLAAAVFVVSAVVSNPLAMPMWAGLIVALTIVGIATAFVRLA